MGGITAVGEGLTADVALAVVVCIDMGGVTAVGECFASDIAFAVIVCILMRSIASVGEILTASGDVTFTIVVFINVGIALTAVSAVGIASRERESTNENINATIKNSLNLLFISVFSLYFLLVSFYLFRAEACGI